MSSRRLVITRSAERQIRDADAWWRVNRTAAREALQTELREALQKLLDNPLIGRLVAGDGLEDVRRLSLNATRYFLYYRIREQEITVLAVWHQSRGGPPPGIEAR